MGLRIAKAAYVMRCVPEDWDAVDLFVINPSRLIRVPIRNFESGLTYDTLHYRPLPQLEEEPVEARKQARF